MLLCAPGCHELQGMAGDRGGLSQEEGPGGKGSTLTRASQCISLNITNGQCPSTFLGKSSE